MRKALFIFILFCFSCSNNLFNKLDKSVENRISKKEAIKRVPPEQRIAMEWLITHMPENDKKSLSLEFLITNSEYAFKSKKHFPWAKHVPDQIFLNYVLPYASLNERRDEWRKDFFLQIFSIGKKC